MPLPKKTIRVFPNPWGFIHHDIGPQGRCHEDTGGRGTTPRYIGSEACPEKTVKLADYEKDPNETRLNPWLIVFRYPVLDASLLGPAEGCEKGIDLPKTAYYLDRLRDGDLIPADERSAEHGARFASLAEAKAAGVADFEANYGAGVFAEAFPAFAEAATKPLEPAQPSARPFLPTLAEARLAAPDAETAAATPDAKSARASRGANGADK